MIRPTTARIDLDAIKSNFRNIVEFLRSQSDNNPAKAGSHDNAGSHDKAADVIAVVKANAYGHGAGQVARALEDAGADLLACADIEEGAALRSAGVECEILVFGALSV